MRIRFASKTRGNNRGQFALGVRTAALFVLGAITSAASFNRGESASPISAFALSATEGPDAGSDAPREPLEIGLSEWTGPGLEGQLQGLRLKTEPLSIDLWGTQFDGKLLKHLQGLNNLRRLYLSSTGISDEDLKLLGTLPNLEVIELSDCNVTVEGVLHLKKSRKLKSLGLGGPRPNTNAIDDKTIEQVVKLWPELESLSLNGAQITDVTLSHIGKLSRLEYLNISATTISDEGLASLAQLPRLSTLHANKTNITDRVLHHLCAITSLEKLDLNYTGISDAGLQEVPRLKHLKRIYFVGTQVTDRGLKFLKPVKTIEFVGPSDKNSREAVEELKESLPRFKANKAG